MERFGNNSYDQCVKRGNMYFAGEKACHRHLLHLSEVKTLEKRNRMEMPNGTANFRSDRSDQKSRPPRKVHLNFPELLLLGRTVPLWFEPKFTEILDKWIAPFVFHFSRHLIGGLKQPEATKLIILINIKNVSKRCQ